MSFRLLILFLGIALGAATATAQSNPQARPANGKRHALLVGVSAYPLLPPPSSAAAVKQLVAPATDVEQMTRLLAMLGFDRDDLTVLADQVRTADGAPTKRRILAELDRLAEVARANDYVTLYFSGHGSGHRATRNNEREVDSMDEIFLPLDVGRWEPDKGRVENALYDDELWVRIERILARGAFVWAIFDACNSATMVRGTTEAEEVARYIPPSALGIPAELAVTDVASATRGGPRPKTAPRALPTNGLVAFYAAQETQSTPETLLPIEGSARRRRGLFTFALERAVARRPSASFGEIAQDIRYQYLAMGRTRPTPLFEGELRRSVAGPQAQEQSSLPVQYIVRHQGGRIVMEAGELHGFRKGQAFALFPDPLSKNTEVLAFATVAEADIIESVLQLTPSAAAECAMSATKRAQPLPTAPFVARPCRLAVNSTLRLSQPELCKAARGPQQPCAESATEHDASLLKKLQQQLASQVAAPVSWVASTQAERRLVVSGARLWFAEPSGQLVADSGRSVPSLPISAGTGVDLEAFATIVRRMGSVANLFRAARVSNELGAARIAAQIVPNQPSRCGEVLAASDEWKVPDSAARIAEGERLCMRFENPHDYPVDVTVLAIDADWGITALYPQPGQSNRLPARASTSTGATLDVRITPEDPAGELYVMLLAVVPQQSDLQVVGFQYLAQPSIPTRAMGQRPEIGVLRLEVMQGKAGD